MQDRLDVDPKCSVVCPSFLAVASAGLSAAGVWGVPQRLEQPQVTSGGHEGDGLLRVRISVADRVKPFASERRGDRRADEQQPAGIEFAILQ
jgi:hypothetical protein